MPTDRIEGGPGGACQDWLPILQKRTFRWYLVGSRHPVRLTSAGGRIFSSRGPRPRNDGRFAWHGPLGSLPYWATAVLFLLNPFFSFWKVAGPGLASGPECGLGPSSSGSGHVPWGSASDSPPGSTRPAMVIIGFGRRAGPGVPSTNLGGQSMPRLVRYPGRGASRLLAQRGLGPFNGKIAVSWGPAPISPSRFFTPGAIRLPRDQRRGLVQFGLSLSGPLSLSLRSGGLPWMSHQSGEFFRPKMIAARAASFSSSRDCFFVRPLCRQIRRRSSPGRK